MCWAAVDLNWAARVRFNYFTRDIGHVRDNSWVELQADSVLLKAAERLPSEAALVKKIHVDGGDGVGILYVDQLLKWYMQ